MTTDSSYPIKAQQVDRKAILPYLLGQMFAGCLLSFPGTSMDVLLQSFRWREGDFGVAMMIQGMCSFAAGLWIAPKLTTETNLPRTLSAGLSFMSLGAVLVYFSPLLRLTLLFPLLGNRSFVVTGLQVLGFCLLGAGNGFNALTNNTKALCSAHASKALMWVSLAFTVGAVFFPIAVNLFFNIVPATHANQNPVLWSFPVAALLPACLGTAAYVLFVQNSQHTNTAGHTSTAKDSHATKTQHSAIVSPSALPGRISGLLLFLYLGMEINLANNLSLFGIHHYKFSPGVARPASAFFWGGIFLTRIVIAWRPPQERIYPILLCFLGALTTVFVLTMRLCSSTPETIWYALILGLGLSLGPVYGVVIGTAATFYPQHTAPQKANSIAITGVLGALTLPPAFGTLTQNWGIQSGFFMLAGVAIVFWSGALALYFLFKNIEKKTASETGQNPRQARSL